MYMMVIVLFGTDIVSKGIQIDNDYVYTYQKINVVQRRMDVIGEAGSMVVFERKITTHTMDGMMRISSTNTRIMGRDIVAKKRASSAIIGMVLYQDKRKQHGEIIMDIK
eukprot:95776_1